MTDNDEKILTEELDESQLTAEQHEGIQAIKRFADAPEMDDEDEFGDISLKSILGGEILQSRFVVRQVVFFMFLVVLALAYTYNRYDSLQDTLLIDSLKVQLQEERYKLLTIESDLLNESRQSKIVEALKHNGDTTLLNSTRPPFAIKREE